MSQTQQRRQGTEEIRDGLNSGEIKSLLLFGVDPLRDFPDTERWKARPRRRRPPRRLLDLRERDDRDGRRRLPARDPRRERRHRHPSRRPPAAGPSLGRPPRRHPPELGRPRRAVAGPRPRHRRRLPAHGLRRPRRSGPLLRRASTDAEIGGRGIRWQDRPVGRGRSRQRARRTAIGTAGHSARAAQAARTTARCSRSRVRRASGPAPSLLGTYRDLWAGPITELNPPLRFLAPQQRVEMSVADAERLGLKAGDEVRVAQNGNSVDGRGRRQGTGRRGHRAS